MNKISKKIVALATMAAFALTLVPAAAFAAPGDADYQTSYVKTSEADVTVAPNEAVPFEFEVYDESGQKEATGDLTNVWVWATDEQGRMTSAASWTDKDGKTPIGSPLTVDNDTVYNVAFSRTGAYTLHAGVTTLTVDGTNTTEDVIADAAKHELNTYDDQKVINVVAGDVTKVEVYEDGNGKLVNWNKDNVGEINLVGDDSFLANGTDTYNVEGYVYTESGRASETDVTITSGNPGVLQFTGAAEDGVVTTDKTGKFNFTFTMNDNRNVAITIAAGDLTYTLRILKETTTAYDIDTVTDGGYVLAGTDDAFTSAACADFSDAVQFSVADIKGDAITGELTGEPAADVTTGDAHAQYLSITEKPKKSTLDAWNLQLVPNGDTYTLEYVIDKDSTPKTDLIPGKYTVRVALTSGDYAEATFNVAEFGTVKDIVLDMEATDKSSGRITKVTDEVTLGQVVEVFAKYVDENGIKIPATEGIDFGANGVAVQDVNFGWDVNGFTTKADVASNESLIGTTVEVTAFSQKYKAYVEQKLTVVDSYNAFSLEFDPSEGAVNEDNDVTVKVVKEDGAVAQVDGQLMAYVADQSNEDAVVTVDVDKWVKDGKGKLTVYASEPTTVDIVVAVKDSSNQGLYAATLEYTAGKEDITAHHNVVMTIGSSEYVVDKQLFTMDAAPYVDSNWRTMVPIRALAEAFDATVTYDNDDRTVTIEYNDQTIVMTVDEATYTVNGVEGEMDTEAVIKGDRTYVPIRFAAEAMGFTVTALYDENSSTASVVFQS